MDGRRFQELCTELLAVKYKNDFSHVTKIQNIVDGLNTVDYSQRLCSEQVAGQIIKHLCYLVPSNHDPLVANFSLLVFNLVSRQEIILEHNVGTVVDYMIKALHSVTPSTCNAVLRALGSVLYENGARLQNYAEALISEHGVLRQIVKSSNEELLRSAVQCVENLCIRVPNHPYLAVESQAWCLSIFMYVLQMPKSAKIDDAAHCKIVVSALRGLQHLFVTSKHCPADQLGSVLAVVRTYILHGIPGVPVSLSPCLYPMPLGQTSPISASTKPKAADSVSLRPSAGTSGEKEGDDCGGSKKARKKRGGRKGKQDKVDKSANQQSRDDVDTLDQSVGSLHLGAASGFGSRPGPVGRDGTSRTDLDEDPLSLYPAWSKASSSDSEFSDTDGGGAARSRSFFSKVRQTALGCFHALVKASEKRLMFGYWSSFLPSSPGHGTSSPLFTVVMKDPSAKARTGALAVLTSLLDGTKQYLQAAEDSEQYRTAPFTPFSVALGYMIKEIHRCLMLALTSEQSPLATTQIIKCLATLIPCVPYNRLRPGLLTRAVRQIKPFFAHRDPNIRVACLSCLGAIVSVQAPLLEVNYILQATRANTRTSETSHTPAIQAPAVAESEANHQESGYHSSQSNLSASVGSNDGAVSDSLNTSFNLGQSLTLGQGSSPLGPSGIPTPQLSSGAQTPSLSDVMGNPQSGGSMSWVLRLCVKNTAPHLLDKRDDSELPTRIVAEIAPARVPARTESSRYVQPLPVRLESLQVLASMCKGYFGFIRHQLPLMAEVVQCCVEDSDVSVQLHGSKLLDELGMVMSHKLQDTMPESSLDLSTQQVLDFWLPLLNGPVPTTMQRTQSCAVRSTLCDCLSTIAAPVFDKLPTDKHILCMTLILGMTSDEDHQVRAAAIRTLGMYAFVPCLRHDVTFVADAAGAILAATEEPLLSVKVKAMWSLGNLTDALATNKEDASEASFMDEFSDTLLLKLFEVATRGALDTDKVRSNAVRALGNLLRYAPQRCLQNSRFHEVALGNGIKALVKNVTSGAMKVRWNACYAIGNMLKNSLLQASDMPWMNSVVEALQAAVRDCKNFKVRINAALSLSIPTRRATYGTPEMYSKTWSSLVECLHNSETTTDLAEFKYSEALIEQVLATLVHLLRHLEGADLSLLTPLLSGHRDFLAGHVERYRSRSENDPPKVAGLEEMADHVNTLQLQCTEPDQKECLQLIHLIFVAVKEKSKTPERASSPLQSAFRQTYD